MSDHPVTVLDSNEQSKKQKLEHLYNTGQRMTVLIWLGINAYILYGYAYQILWNEVYPQHKGVAIALLVIFCYLDFHSFVAWGAIQVYGPGKVTSEYPSNCPPDSAFVCNEQGYSLYCSYCNHNKPNRTHHSAFTDTCIPAMDHFCPWVGHVIGQNNIKFFFQFCWATASALILVLVTLFVYQHNQLPNINGNAIALYVLSALFLLFLVALNGQHVYYVICGHTTLEHMSAKRGNDVYVNFPYKENIRRVALARPEDLRPYNKLYNKGVINNLFTIMGPFYTWLLPIRPAIEEPQINQSYVDELVARQDEIERANSAGDPNFGVSSGSETDISNAIAQLEVKTALDQQENTKNNDTNEEKTDTRNECHETV